MAVVWAEQALTPDGWQPAVRVEIGEDGTISSVRAGVAKEGYHVGMLLPAPANLHSHAFQRAMAGMSERRGPDPTDTFWTWRQLMFRFLDHLTPDDVEAITAHVQMEMLEAGYAASVEFHYLHHQPGGAPYSNIAEMSERIVAAAVESGIGLTLLPVLYRYGGCDGRPLAPGQIRFGNSLDQFSRLFDGARAAIGRLRSDARIGVAPHSLRAVSADDLDFTVELVPDAPIHMHLAEQVGEVEEVVARHGARPVEWLLGRHRIDQRWCLIHCTQMQPHETTALAQSGAVAGLCPITESSLGDGIFDGVRFAQAGGRFGIGSDSNIRISLAEELRTLEYSQRLRDRARALHATREKSTGRVLFEEAAAGGGQAAGRLAGAIGEGMLADLVAFDRSNVDLEGRAGDDVIDSFIFVAGDAAISDVWSAGQHLVEHGRHIRRDTITQRYRATMQGLRSRL